MLAGKKTGGFSAPAQLRDKAGRILRLGQYWDQDTNEWTGVADGKFKESLGVGAALADWDEDADLDLVLGSSGGHLFLRRNEGSKEKHAFAPESEQLMCGKEPLKVSSGEAIPTLADWDGDGLFDILSGGASGGAVWFRNIGKRGAPAFTPAATLIESRGPRGQGSPADPTWPGRRTQVHAADYDSDGDLDLLVGDHCTDERIGAAKPEMHGWVWLFRRLTPAR
ncbi:MAG: VCBS repeat-containing protein [Planctomycetes bacterium]|nr:VCBS repeat-containing protein [Planctomycetota bacterium]